MVDTSRDSGLFLSSVGAKGDGITDNTDLFQAMLDSDPSTVFILPRGRFKISRTLRVRKRGVCFIGYNYGREEDNATIIEYHGLGDLFEIGDSSIGYYDGYQGFKLKNISLVNKSPDQTSLSNPMSGNAKRHYGKNSCAVREWRGGGMIFENVQMEHFNWGIWGIQSDINRFVNCNFHYNKEAIHLEAGSDQLIVDGLYSFGNDITLNFSGITGARLNDCQFVKEGSATVSPIQLDGCNSIRFSGCWFEGMGALGITVPSYVKLGATTECRSIWFRDSILAISSKQTGGQPVCNYFVEVVRGKKVLIDELGGYPQNLKKLVAFSGNSPIQQVTLRSHLGFTFEDGTYADNNGTGRADLSVVEL